MDNLVGNFAKSIVRLFMLTIFAGGLIGFVCQNRIVTIAIHPENVRKAREKTGDDFRETGQEFFDSYNSNEEIKYEKKVKARNSNYQNRNSRNTNGRRNRRR